MIFISQMKKTRGGRQKWGHANFSHSICFFSISHSLAHVVHDERHRHGMAPSARAMACRRGDHDKPDRTVMAYGPRKAL